MTPDQRILVRQSFDFIRPMSHQAAGLFYQRLFEIAPEVAPLFAESDMKSQGHRMMAALNLIAHSLDEPTVLIPIARELAQRHVGYGVRPEHYQPVGEALIWALETGLGPNFDTETKAAWAAAYGALSDAMIAAAYGPDGKTGIEAAE
ncbi:globin domain-containing protein [Algicella marina]|uniref:Hemin receptor n=1 Tax=Algicella marina TaxID=2683284 RepID=A0A6P1T563_9RHOB|nr:globin domain-containing protein [Algicella marina]QHQ36860.1 hemin receptor [Algicella marina]